MSVALYIAVGHGQMPDGRFDPGAVHGKLVEHTLAWLVVEAAVDALRRSGFHDFIAEVPTSAGTADPDYRGSVIRANAAGATYVCEVHFNAGSTSGHGTETLVYRNVGPTGAWAKRVQDALQGAVGIVNRGIKERPDLWLLRGTNGHAIIPEVAFVDGDAVAIEDHPKLCANAGEAIARATLAQLGHRYTPPTADVYDVTVPGGARDLSGLPNVDEALATARHFLATGTTEVVIHRRPR